MAAAVSTPINTVNRENLTVLIRNNAIHESYVDDGFERMETDSPVSKPNLQVVSKKLFHSPLTSPLTSLTSLSSPVERSEVEQSRRTRKRKLSLLPSSCEKIKRAYMNECERDSYSPEAREGMRKKVLISLFHNKEYSVDMSY